MELDLELLWIPLGLIALVYSLVDVNYFLRVAYTIGKGKLFEKPIKIDGTSEIFGVCTSQDLDLFMNYMSNSRYIREADFGRFHFIERTGLYQILKKANGHIMQAACNIRYRRPIPLLAAYKVTTRIITWDEKSIYFEQQFITTSDNFVRAVLVSHSKLINLDAAKSITKLLDKDLEYRPEVPEELSLWISSLQASSLRLRKQD